MILKQPKNMFISVNRDCGADYPYNLDVGEMFHTWEGHKDQDILTYRDQSFASKFTGEQSQW